MGTITQSQYTEIVDTYSLSRLKPGSDLQVTKNGDLAMSPRGDIKLGDSYFNALFHFVNSWISNRPTLKLLTKIVEDSNLRKQEFEKKRNQIAQEYAESLMRGEEPERDILVEMEEGGQIDIGRDACAGTLFIITNTLLQGINSELRCASFFNSTGQLILGYSFGKVVEAASNNFRHFDEWTMQWVKNKQFTPQQMNSIGILSTVMKQQDLRHFSTNVCGNLFLDLTNGSFEKLESLVMDFAKELVDKGESNSTVP